MNKRNRASHGPLLAAICIASLVSLLGTTPLTADCAASEETTAGMTTLHVTGPTGAWTETGSREPGDEARGNRSPEFSRDDYLWRSVHDIMIGSSTGISHENYPPTPVELFAATGDGTPYWTETGNYAQVAARGGVYALADHAGSGINLTGWYRDLATPAWSLALPGCAPAGYTHSLHINMDATRVFFGCFDPNQVRFLALDAATGTILVDTIIPLDNPSLRNMGSSDDGRFVDLNCGLYHVIFDVDAGSERARIDTGASTRPVGISETGEWVIAAFGAFRAWQWDPGTETYVLRWIRTTPAHYAGVTMITEEGFCIVGWYSNAYNQNRIQRWSLETGQPDWQLDLPTTPGTVQDLPVSIDFSRDRSKIAFAFWGDTYLISPEILVIDDDGNQLFSLHAPGSMFDVALAEDGRYVSATGKLVHASIFGNGSDAYCGLVVDPAAVDDDQPGHVSAATVRLSATPNPFRAATTIFAATAGVVPGREEPGIPDRLRITDAGGRLVRVLTGLEDGPRIGFRWDGKNRHGQPMPAGVYYCAPNVAEQPRVRVVRLP